jgi:hypothetical protein
MQSVHCLFLDIDAISLAAMCVTFLPVSREDFHCVVRCTLGICRSEGPRSLLCQTESGYRQASCFWVFRSQVKDELGQSCKKGLYLMTQIFLLLLFNRYSSVSDTGHPKFKLGSCRSIRSLRRDQLYFANISLCIFDEVAAGFCLDGKFLEPRSDDTLAQLTGNLEKQRKGSVQRTFESQMLFVGKALFESYTVKKADARRQGRPLEVSLSVPPSKTARSLTAPLKQALEEHVTVRTVPSGWLKVPK